jgi:hypothetical protein
MQFLRCSVSNLKLVPPKDSEGKEVVKEAQVTAVVETSRSTGGLTVPEAGVIMR